MFSIWVGKKGGGDKQQMATLLDTSRTLSLTECVVINEAIDGTNSVKPSRSLLVSPLTKVQFWVCQKPAASTQETTTRDPSHSEGVEAFGYS